MLNVSDHFTRAKYRQKKGETAYRVIGLIFGRVEGRTLEIENSLELNYEAANTTDPLFTDIKIDMEFARQRKELYNEMWPSLDVIGWYSVKSNGDKNAD